MSLLKFINVEKDYLVGNQVVKALNQITIEIKKGEFTAIVGPSGSGKTTFLNIVGCLDTPTSGETFLEEQKISSLDAKKLAHLRKDKIGFIFQAYNLIPVLNAYENVEFPLIIMGKKFNDNIKKSTMDMLNVVGLSGMEFRKPNELSGGQQQRVAIARALVKKPTLVLADEPTANLDSTLGQNLLEVMGKINEKYNTTFVFSTHDPMVMEFAKRVIVLKDGKIDSDEIKN